MPQGCTYRIREVAALAGVSVRTLHHYDAIGLLTPSGRSAGGYRLYDDRDLLRLQQILIERELGLPLEAIKRSVDDPRFDRRSALTRQHAQLTERAARTAEMLRAVETALAALQDDGDKMMQDTSRDGIEAIFAGFDPSEYAAEVEQRWGDTEAYAEATRRTRRYSEVDWQRYHAESDAIMHAAAALFRAGAAVDGGEARAVVERHRRSIDRWFYPCDARMHAALADMYEADPRFAANIDRYEDGLTAWLSASIRAHAGC